MLFNGSPVDSELELKIPTVRYRFYKCWLKLCKLRTVILLLNKSGKLSGF